MKILVAGGAGFIGSQSIYYNPPMNRDGQKVKHPGYATDIITDLSLDWLKQRDPSRPFMLLCWQKAPHRNWQPALRDLDFDHDRTYPLPDSLFDDYSGRSLAERDQNMTIAKTMQLKHAFAAGFLPPERK